jgi:hypothetical protein
VVLGGGAVLRSGMTKPPVPTSVSRTAHAFVRSDATSIRTSLGHLAVDEIRSLDHPHHGPLLRIRRRHRERCGEVTLKMHADSGPRFVVVMAVADRGQWTFVTVQFDDYIWLPLDFAADSHAPAYETLLLLRPRYDVVCALPYDDLPAGVPVTLADLTRER